MHRKFLVGLSCVGNNATATLPNFSALLAKRDFSLNFANLMTSLPEFIHIHMQQWYQPYLLLFTMNTIHIAWKSEQSSNLEKSRIIQSNSEQSRAILSNPEQSRAIQSNPKQSRAIQTHQNPSRPFHSSENIERKKRWKATVLVPSSSFAYVERLMHYSKQSVTQD